MTTWICGLWGPFMKQKMFKENLTSPSSCKPCHPGLGTRMKYDVRDRDVWTHGKRSYAYFNFLAGKDTEKISIVAKKWIRIRWSRGLRIYAIMSYFLLEIGGSG